MSATTRPAEIVPRVAAGPWVPPFQTTPDQINDPEQHNVVRKFSLALALVVVFLRISAFHQVEAFLLHVNLKLLYVFGIPAVLGTALCGGLGRTFRASPAYYWTGYALWMVVALPFSTWHRGAFDADAAYIRTNVVMLFLAGGLVIGWKEYQSLMRAMVWGAVGTLLVARVFQNPIYQERFGIELGTVSNPNDFACHLMLCIPFLYWVVLTSKVFVLRIACLAGIGYGVMLVIQTASRGALVALIVTLLFVMIWGTGIQRIALIALVPVGFVGIVSTVSPEALRRIVSFSASEKNASAEAILSSEQRQYLFNKSIEYTIKFPIFGLGTSQFPVYEGTHNLVVGTHGSWHGTHNTFTQVSSENGIPGLIFFAGGLIVTFKIFYSVFRKARSRTDSADIKNAALCLMLAMTGFVVSFTVLNFAYFFYQPLLGGLAVALKAATDMEFARRDLAAPTVVDQTPGPFIYHRTAPSHA